MTFSGGLCSNKLRSFFYLLLLNSFFLFTSFSCGGNSSENRSGNNLQNPLSDLVVCTSASLASFPGAEGFGACATGARSPNARVFYVTNLAADPHGEIPGSFQWALNQEGPRYILFKVSGVINGTVEMNRGDVTIAGQTSPNGVIVRGLDIQGNQVYEADHDPLPTIYPQNFIVRHLRSRVVGGPAGSPWLDEDGLRLHHAVNGIIDHFSSENASDESMQISFSRDITIQNSMLAETIGDHYLYGGMLINYSDPPRNFPLTRLSIHHNLWNRIVGRLPEISRDNLAANQSVLEIELSSNLCWDPGYYITIALHQPENESALLYYHMNVVENLMYGRMRNPDALSDFTYGLMDSSFLEDLPAGSPTTTYFSGNQINLYPDRGDYQLLYRDNDYPNTFLGEGGGLPYGNILPVNAISSRHNFPIINYTSAENLRNYMIENVGAFPRDHMDQRLLADVQAGTFDNSPRNVNSRGDAFDITNSTSGAPTDSDEDGMPDSWEMSHGLDPHVFNANGTELSSNSGNGIEACISGYSNLECYLNELSALKIHNP